MGPVDRSVFPTSHLSVTYDARGAARTQPLLSTLAPAGVAHLPLVPILSVEMIKRGLIAVVLLLALIYLGDYGWLALPSAAQSERLRQRNARYLLHRQAEERQNGIRLRGTANHRVRSFSAAPHGRQALLVRKPKKRAANQHRFRRSQQSQAVLIGVLKWHAFSRAENVTPVEAALGA